MRKGKVSGVGINDLGWSVGTYSKCTWYQKKVYALWQHMLNRCYNPKDSAYKTYGAKGCVVQESWKRLSVFAQDIKKLPGYIYWALPGSRYELDKDLLRGHCLIYDNKHCWFIEKSLNVKERNNRLGMPIQDPVVCAKCHTPEVVQKTAEKLKRSCTFEMSDGSVLHFSSCKEASEHFNQRASRWLTGTRKPSSRLGIVRCYYD